MSPTTRSARAGGAALREGTPISAGHDVSVAPRLDGSWVVQPREGRSAARHPPRTGPPKDAHGLFTPLVDALDHGPGNGCVSHDPAFAAWRDNLRVRDAAVYRAAPRIDDTAADVGKTAAAGHRRRRSSAPTRDPSRRDDENRDPAEKSSCVVVGVGVGVDVGPDTRREPKISSDDDASPRPDIYAVQTTEDEDADAVRTGAMPTPSGMAAAPSIPSTGADPIGCTPATWRTPRPAVGIPAPPTSDAWGWGRAVDRTAAKTPRCTAPLSLTDDAAFSPWVESDGGMYGLGANPGNLGANGPPPPRGFTLDANDADGEDANYFQNMARLQAAKRMRAHGGLHAPSPGMFAPTRTPAVDGNGFTYPSPAATDGRTPAATGGRAHIAALDKTPMALDKTPVAYTPAPRRYIQLESEVQAPVSSRGARPRIAAASRLATESGVLPPATEPEPLDWLSPAARPSEKSSEKPPERSEKTEKPPPEKTDGPSEDAADEVGGFAFDAGGGGARESPGFGGFRFAEETAPTPSPGPAGIFQTASGKTVTPISADAMRRARGMFQDDTAEFRFQPGTRERGNGASGGGIFQTASGKDVAVSADAIRRARIALGDEHDGASTPAGETNNATKNVTPGGGDVGGFKFQTASGKTVTPSAAAMRRGERVLAETAPRGSGPEDTARKRRIDDAGLIDDATGSHHGRTTGVSASPALGVGLFRTGTGRAVAVSDDAARRARSILEAEPALTAAAPPAPAPAAAPAAAPAPGGFKPPARTKQFNPPIRPGTRAVASTASRLGRGGGAGTGGTGGTGGAPSVHDLFASRPDRERLGSFFDYLKPGERPGAPSVVLDPQVRAMSADTAVGYRVRDETNDRVLDASDVRAVMISEHGCLDRLLEPDWCANAYRWTVWTQSCVARAFPDAADAIRAPAVIARILYRYEREILRAERPWVRRVLERDTPAKAPAVLCVAAVRSNGRSNGRARLELTDGWYGVDAALDAQLTALLRRGHPGLQIGAKVLVQGAELRGGDEPVPPLSKAAKDVHLALHFNGVRPARWDAKLGARRRRVAVPLRTLRPDGGACAFAVVYVERVYPGTWIETDKATGARTRRGDRAEALARDRWERARDAEVERIKIEGGAWGVGSREVVSEEDARGMLRAKGFLERDVRRATRLRVSGVRKLAPGARSVAGPTGAALLTAYDLPDDLIATMTEGSVFAVNDLTCARAFADGSLELATTRATRWIPLTRAALAKARLAPMPTPRVTLADSGQLGGPTLPPGAEFDAVGYLIHASAPTPANAPRSQWAFLAISSSNYSSSDLLAVEIDARTPETFVSADDWGAGRGWDERAMGGTIGTIGTIGTFTPPGPPLALRNLTYVAHDVANGLKVARATELTDVTCLTGTNGPRSPRLGAAREALDAWIRRVDARALVDRVRRLTGSNPGGSNGGSADTHTEDVPTGRVSVGAFGCDGWSLSQAKMAEDAAMATLARKREEAEALRAAGLDDDDDTAGE